MNRHTGRVTAAADRSRADRLHEVIAGELDRRRADVLSIDGRLAGSLDLLVDFVSDGGKRMRPEFLWCGWRAGDGPEAGPAADAALRVGAALEFLVGAKKRAPFWMRRAGLEWLHRLLSDPKRLWRRYASSVLPLLLLFKGEIAGRQRRPG